MAKYRTRLPQLSDQLFLTDAGMETYLIFHEGADLPYFASFDLMKNDAGIAQVRRYYARYATMAHEAGLGFVFETPTWRANRDWAAKLGYDAQALADVNRRAVALMARDARRIRDAALADGDLRQYRPAAATATGRTRMMSAERGAGLSRRADQRVPRHRGRLRQRLHAQLRRRGDRRGARRQGRRHAGGDLVHGRDRRQAADRADAEGRHHGNRR